MEIILLLMVVIAALLLAIYIRLGHQPTTQAPAYEHNDNSDEIRGIRDELERVNATLEEIRYVTDIIEKYKLPDKDERKLIDQIRIDNEISEMMDRRK